MSQRDSPESNLARSITERDGYRRDGSIVEPTAHAALNRLDGDSNLAGPPDYDDDSSHNTDERSDSTSGSSTAASDAECLPGRETQCPTHVPPSQMPLWHDMVLLANSTSISHPKEDNSHGLGYEVLKLMCRASRKVVAIGSIMAIGYGHV